MDETQRFIEIKKSIEELSNKKIRVEERLKHQKEKLNSLIKEIQEKGYDPTKLSEIREKKQKELNNNLSKLEEELEKITEELNSIEV